MNEFVDMHVHSKFSIDGMSTMEDYCLIAGKTGTRVICFTEHVDFNSAEKNLSIVKDNRKKRPSQTLCKPPMWCRIEAPHWRFYNG